jgi:hypothetical protein
MKAPGPDIYRGVDHLGLRWTGSFMEKPDFTVARSFNVRVIMVIMRVLVVE